MLKKNFTERARDIHGDKYIYDKVPNEFKANNCVTIICPIHGEFTQCARTHYRGHGCPYCKVEKTKNVLKLSTELFLAKYEEKFGKIYDTSLVEYKNFETPIKMVCSEHGVFEKTTHDLMRGKGCPYCGIEKSHLTKRLKSDEVFKRAIKLHNGKYFYDKFIYTRMCDKGIITCPIHGDFEQTMRKHLMGSGCPHCKSSSLEIKVKKFLEEKNIKFEYQKKFKWLGLQSLDFYLPEYNVAIECQGIQHFRPVSFGYHGDVGKRFERILIFDKKKNELCGENGVKLLYYSNLGIEYPYNVFEDLNLMLKEIIIKG